MNPAPTLLDDWLTPTGFGIIVAILLVVAVIVVVAENLRDRREADTPEQGPPAYEVSGCTIEGCPRVGVALMPSHTGYIWVCHRHAPGVAEWTGPAVFDQTEESA